MKKIMIVDDAQFMRMMLKDIIKEISTDVVEASNGAEAVELYKLHKPDIVTMDITMPEMDGINAVKAIKDFDAGATIIMCSAMGQQAMVIDAIHAGAKDFIVKPFSKDKVIESVKKFI